MRSLRKTALKESGDFGSGASDLVVRSFLETLYCYFWMRVRVSALGYYFRIFLKVKMNLCSEMHRWKYVV